MESKEKPESRLLRTKAAMAYIGVGSKNTLKKFVKSGLLTEITDISENRNLYDKRELDNLIDHFIAKKKNKE